MQAGSRDAESKRMSLGAARWRQSIDTPDVSGCPGPLRGCLLALMDATPGLVMLSSSDGGLLYMNGMGRQVLGYDRSANLPARRMFELYTPRSCKLLREEAVPACLDAGVWRGEATLLDRNRQEIPVSQVLMAHRVQEQGNDTTVLSSIAWDIRELKQVEQQLRHQATH
ncbi:MAG TPA: PAS domain-containing protein, partial [Steroidobacteraceae bacterium]|nr:PAS domain-containing protein [Steroidobacteraceae bacterium]